MQEKYIKSFIFSQPSLDFGLRQVKQLFQERFSRLQYLGKAEGLRLDLMRWSPYATITGCLVNIADINTYIHENHQRLLQSSEETSTLLNVYTARLTLKAELQHEEQYVLRNHMLYFYGMVEYLNDFKLVDSLVLFSLAATPKIVDPQEFSPNLFYFILRGKLSYKVFFRSISHIFKHPGYFDFDGVMDELIEKICLMLEVLLREHEEKSDSLEILAVKDFLTVLPMKVNDRPHNRPQQHPNEKVYYEIASKLIRRQSFNEKVLAFITKFGFEVIFQYWIRMLINTGATIPAIKIVERALFYHTSQAEHLKILRILDDNPAWTSEWANMITPDRRLYFCRVLLNDEPYCFTVMNKLLQHSYFRTEQEFGDLLITLGYQDQLNKFLGIEEVRESVTTLVKLMVDEWHDLLLVLFEKDQNVY